MQVGGKLFRVLSLRCGKTLLLLTNDGALKESPIIIGTVRDDLIVPVFEREARVKYFRNIRMMVLLRVRYAIE